MRDQSRLHSLLETLASIAIGFVVSLGITAVVLPAYGHLHGGEHLARVRSATGVCVDGEKAWMNL